MPESLSSTATLPAEHVIRPRKGFIGLDFQELWSYRELFLFLAWRNVLIRYKQTYLGFAWAVLQPLLIMLSLVFVFAKMADVDFRGAPPVIVILSATVAWVFFSNAISEGSQSLLASRNMVSKVYFPRLAIPLSSVISGLVDLAIAAVLLGGFMVYYGVTPRWQWVLLPGYIAIAFFAATAASLLLSAMNVKYRDVKYVIPFIVRIGALITPVGFPTVAVMDKFPQGVLLFYMNPMVCVIEGIRWCVLGDTFSPDMRALWMGLAVTVILLFWGLLYFRNTEKTFADTI